MMQLKRLDETNSSCPAYMKLIVSVDILSGKKKSYLPVILTEIKWDKETVKRVLENYKDGGKKDIE